MKKLCFITNSYPFGAGESTFLFPELDYLNDVFDITLVSCGTGEKEADVPAGIELLQYTNNSFSRILGCAASILDPLFLREIVPAYKTNGIPAVKRSLICLADAKRFGRWLRKKIGRTDVVYSFWHTAPFMGALLNKKKLGNPLAVTRAHRYDLYHEHTDDNYQAYKKHCDKLLDRMYLISEQGKHYYLDNFSVSDPPKCHVRYLGADNDRTSPYEESSVLRICSCAHMKPVKRIDIIIEALSLVDMPVEWVHFGGGPLDESLKALASEKLDCKPDCKYTFTGPVPNEYVREYMACHSFDCFVSASVSEGLPVSIMEAASFAIPTIATDAGGTNELVNSETGILLPVDLTPTDLANALVKLKSMSADETRAVRKAAYDRWKNNFVASDNARRFCDELLELCENR